MEKKFFEWAIRYLEFVREKDKILEALWKKKCCEWFWSFSVVIYELYIGLMKLPGVWFVVVVTAGALEVPTSYGSISFKTGIGFGSNLISLFCIKSRLVNYSELRIPVSCPRWSYAKLQQRYLDFSWCMLSLLAFHFLILFCCSVHYNAVPSSS